MNNATKIQLKMLHTIILLFALAHAKLYNVAPAEDLALVKRQLIELTRDYRDGLPRNGADNVVCIPVAGPDSRQRAYSHIRHVLHHHAGIRVTYESYREYLQRGSDGPYDNRFCTDVSDLDHIKRALERVSEL
jgi:hypothetical protein